MGFDKNVINYLIRWGVFEMEGKWKDSKKKSSKRLLQWCLISIPIPVRLIN
jgi:hypothetical protein